RVTRQRHTVRRPMRKARQLEIEPIDDATLVGRARAGDAGAFEALFDRHWEPVFRITQRLLRDEAAAEDVTQEVFVAAYRKLGGFRGESLFSTWLHRIAVNRALEWRRTGERRRETSLDDTGDIDAVRTPEMSAASEVESMELREALWQAVDGLPPKQR